MNGNSLVVDTNILIYLLNGDEYVNNLLRDSSFHISFITQIELRASKKLNSGERNEIDILLDSCTIHHSSNTISRIAVKMKLAYGLKIPATAIDLNLPLITSDFDFRKVEEIELIQLEN
ncbi:MAG: type II toxin-antitoxin system VapC family toxin [Cytophagales bacterium]|nr:type II toxin-antitoxin system VapC family toxin [Cytophagales bacterium]